MPKTINIPELFPGLTEDHWAAARAILGPYQGENLAYVKLSREGKLIISETTSDDPAPIKKVQYVHTNLEGRPLPKLPYSFIIGPDQEIYAIQHEDSEEQKQQKYMLFTKRKREYPQNSEALLETTYTAKFLEEYCNDRRRVKVIINQAYQTDPNAPLAKAFLIKTEQYAHEADFNYEVGLSPVPAVRLASYSDDEKIDSSKTVQFFHILGENLSEFLDNNRDLLPQYRVLIAFLCVWSVYKFQTSKEGEIRIHRDIKPDNLLIQEIVSENGEKTYKIVLIDYESKISIPDGEEFIYREVRGFGTKGFIPPEEETPVILDGKPLFKVTLKRDVFALGKTIVHGIFRSINLEGHELGIYFHPMMNSFDERPSLEEWIPEFYSYAKTYIPGFSDKLKASLGETEYKQFAREFDDDFQASEDEDAQTEENNLRRYGVYADQAANLLSDDDSDRDLEELKREMAETKDYQEYDLDESDEEDETQPDEPMQILLQEDQEQVIEEEPSMFAHRAINTKEKDQQLNPVKNAIIEAAREYLQAVNNNCLKKYFKQHSIQITENFIRTVESKVFINIWELQAEMVQYLNAEGQYGYPSRTGCSLFGNAPYRGDDLRREIFTQRNLLDPVSFCGLLNCRNVTETSSSDTTPNSPSWS